MRIGNAASKQFQLDVYGEVMDAMYQARRTAWNRRHRAGTSARRWLTSWKAWQEPDEGIWEVRGGRQHFTHSKVMAWVAFDRAVKAIENFGLEGPAERWRKRAR